MAQPEFVPSVAPASRRAGALVPGEVLPVPVGWHADRPGDPVAGEGPPSGPKFGNAGPDQGYALLLVDRWIPRLVLTSGELADDAAAGCLGLALRRASIFHRAPIGPDIELAFSVWGFLIGSGAAPDDLVVYRKPVFAGAAHDYPTQREIAARVPEHTLRLRPTDVANRLAADWRSLLGA